MNTKLKVKLQTNFNKAAPSYDQNCTIQNEICKQSIELLLLYENHFNYIADFACGTGESTKQLIQSVNYQQCNCNYYTVPSTPLTSNSPFLFDNIMQKDTPYGYTESDLKTNFIDKRLRQYSKDNFRILNAVEHVYNVPFANFLPSKNEN